MTSVALFCSLIGSTFLFILPRGWAVLPLVMGATYIPVSEALEVGPLHFPALRLLVVVGFVRVFSKGERMEGGFRPLDWLMVAWAGWLFLTSFAHESDVFITRMGDIFNAVGIYFLVRVFVRDLDDLRRLFKGMCLLLLPLALAMLFEKFVGKNPFSLFAGIPSGSILRHGHYRARGPFAHAITAGTVGGLCVPMAIYFWKHDKAVMLLGLAATGGIVVASGSSGPVMTALAAVMAVGLWFVKKHMRLIRWAGIGLILFLDVMMKDPVYYLVARIDITGGSTGWHRARLIQMAIEHLNEWWVAGTDVTRHWMPSGVVWSDKHTDITNHYLAMGVVGGLPLMFIFIAIVWMAFRTVSKTLAKSRETPGQDGFLIWTLGAMLFAHAITFLSVSYYDQSTVFLYLLLGCIGSLASLAFVESTVSQTRDSADDAGFQAAPLGA